jgi:deoxyinosine 3'endonuclease (endonuclease V)
MARCGWYSALRFRRSGLVSHKPISLAFPTVGVAAAVVYAMVEGLAGVVDAGVAFFHTQFEPRWAATENTHAETVIKYPDSGGYVAYTYLHDKNQKRIEFVLAGSGDRFDCHVLLPQEAKKRDAPNR